MKAVALCLAIALLVRGLTAATIPHPGFVDASYAWHVTTQLLAGKGLQEEVVWNYLVPPGAGAGSEAGPAGAAAGRRSGPAALPRPSNAYWPPGPALFAAAGARLLPDTLPLWRRAQALPVLGSALVVAGTFVMAGGRRRAATVAALVLCSGIYFPYWVSTDSFTLFAILGGAALWLASGAAGAAGAAGAPPHRPWLCLLGAGVLAGLAQGARADGLLLLAAPLAAATSRLGRSERLSGMALALVGAGAGLLPLLARNLLTWGTVAPPGTGTALWLTRYDDLFLYQTAPSLARWWGAGLGPAILTRADALLVNLGVLGQPLLYYALPLGLLGAWHQRRSPSVWVPLVYLAAIYAVHSLVFPFQGTRGGFFHSLVALLPWLMLWTTQGLECAVSWGAGRRHWPVDQAQTVFGAALVAFGLLASVYFTRSLGERWEARRRAYAAAATWLDANAVPGARLMGVDPPGIWDATGRSAVVTPADGMPALLAAAGAYGVAYVLLEPAWPAYLVPVYDDRAPGPGLRHVADAGAIRIYRVSAGPPTAGAQRTIDAVSAGGNPASSSAAVCPSRG